MDFARIQTCRVMCTKELKNLDTWKLLMWFLNFKFYFGKLNNKSMAVYNEAMGWKWIMQKNNLKRLLFYKYNKSCR